MDIDKHRESLALVANDRHEAPDKNLPALHWDRMIGHRVCVAYYPHFCQYVA